MPVKVRCPGCQKILNAPDRARGKAIRCPDCETVIRVPAQRQVAKQAAAPPPPSSSGLIANLDLRRLEDLENRICPNCGADVAPDDIECPKCEVMLETGQLSERRKAARSRSGPDPKLFFKGMPGDAWRFLMENKKLAFRTGTYAVLFSALFVGCILMLLWCTRTPPRMFWGFCGFVAIMVPPGWAWFLHTLIINSALEKKKKLPKRIRFDFFQCSALGIKFLAWTLAMGLPFFAVALVCYVVDYPLVAMSFAGAGLLFAILVFPIAMVHMAMPVTIPAWQFWKIDALFFRVALPATYWAFFLMLTMLPALAVTVAAVVVSGEDVVALVDTLEHNADIERAQTYVLERRGTKNAVLQTDDLYKLSEEKPAEADWLVTVVPAVCWLLASGLFGVAAVFNMRSNGLFAQYFRERLDLITMAPEVKYVPKPVVDEEEAAKQMNVQQFAFVSALILAFGFAGGVIYGVTVGGGFLSGMGWGLIAGGTLMAFTGIGTVIIEAFKESPLWGLGVVFVPFCELVFIVLFWERSKWALFYQVAAIPVQMIGWTVVFLTAAPVTGPAPEPRTNRCGWQSRRF